MIGFYFIHFQENVLQNTHVWNSWLFWQLFFQVKNSMIKAGLCSAHNSNNCIKCFSLRQPAYIVKCLMHISHFVTQNIKKIFLSGTWLFFPLQLCDSEDTIITGLICYSILICAKSTSSPTQHWFCIITVNVNSVKKNKYYHHSQKVEAT